MSTQPIAYPLSKHQNEIVAYHNAQISQTTAKAEHLRFEAQHAAEMAKSAVDAGNVFLTYIIKEFELPKSKAGWASREVRPGEYELFAEVEEPDTNKTVEPVIPVSMDDFFPA